MEPGIPDPNSRASQLGIYNLDPAVRFWATPPIHGCLAPYVIHPAAYTFKLPENVSFAEGAMVEPLAVGMHAAVKAKIKPGDLAVVMGAGPIGIVTALAAFAGGCSQVVLTDVQQPKLDLAAALGPIRPVNVAKENLRGVIDQLTEGWGLTQSSKQAGSLLPFKVCTNAMSRGPYRTCWSTDQGGPIGLGRTQRGGGID
jgi:D-xylulose reductase